MDSLSWWYSLFLREYELKLLFYYISFIIHIKLPLGLINLSRCLIELKFLKVKKI